MTKREKIRAQAQRAHRAGKALMDCPYPRGSKRFLWRWEFREAAGIPHPQNVT